MNGKMPKREKLPCSENCQREFVILQKIPGMDTSMFGKFSIPGIFLMVVLMYLVHDFPADVHYTSMVWEPDSFFAILMTSVHVSRISRMRPRASSKSPMSFLTFACVSTQ